MSLIELYRQVAKLMTACRVLEMRMLVGDEDGGGSDDQDDDDGHK